MTTQRFTDRTALVTGAGSGIGRAVALALAAEGAHVVVAGRAREPLDATAALIEEAGGKALAVAADVTRPADVEALVTAAAEHFGSLDVAVNNAGVFRGGVPLAELSVEDWHTQLDINVTGMFLALRAEVRHMRAQPGGGTIVNIASTFGAHKRSPGATAYAASKAAVSALTRGAALDHIGDGVRVNAVSPGATATSMSLRPGETEAGRAERMREETPLGRVSAVAEVAAAVLYLASDDSASVVGTDLVVDGGQTA
ncbi:MULTISPECIES: SDR family NAD(P)-dependent oxidoreductase [unclassified Streptomyces]|uniref:SDR family NAD(P)-dependent oxidoreductase n=1 Tax=unclassified Streptomyces TaxID=2593676 RepID=UPI002E28AE1B|nr:glucose 1-dehydrogenase [Streptomyces sp. NBC_00334]